MCRPLPGIVGLVDGNTTAAAAKSPGLGPTTSPTSVLFLPVPFPFPFPLSPPPALSILSAAARAAARAAVVATVQAGASAVSDQVATVLGGRAGGEQCRSCKVVKKMQITYGGTW